MTMNESEMFNPTIVPEPASMQTRGMSESDEAVLFPLTVDVQQPASVQFTLRPRLLPWSQFIREQVFVAFLTVQVVPAWQV